MSADAPLAQDGAPAPVVEQIVNYHFPVEVELVGTLSDEQRRDVAEFVFQELDAALEGQG